MGQVWQLSVVACRGPLPACLRALARSRAIPASVPPTAAGGVARGLTTPSPAAPLQITWDLKTGQCVRGRGKRKRFHVLYYQTSETGWVPATNLKDFKQNLEVPRARFWFVLISGRTAHSRSVAQLCQSHTPHPRWWP